jgi:hypothetical protein
MDFEVKDKQRIVSLQTNDLLKSKNIIQVSEFLDLFEPNFYLELVRDAYKEYLSRLFR